MKRALLILGVLLAIAPAAQASPVAPWATADGDGNPVLYSWTFAAFSPVVWRSCPLDGECVTLSATGYELRPGPTAPGTRFETTIIWPPERPETWTSPIWRGTYTNLTAPALIGEPRVGATVNLRPGTWSGGWDGLTSEFGMSCETADGANCEQLVPGAPLGREQLGRYLFATRDHAPHNYPPRDSAAPDPRHTSGPWGPVTELPFAPPGRQGAERVAPTAPVVSLRARALRSQGRVRLGRVRCAQPCKVSVKVSGGGRKAYRTTFTASGVTVIAAPARRGTLTVRVHVDGKLLASGRVAGR